MNISIKIYYADTDCGGIVYYARYLEYFERARTEWFESRGLSVRKLEKQGISFVVKNAAAEYISPAKYGDTINVNIKLDKVKAASMIFTYHIRESVSGRNIVTGSTMLAAVNGEMKPVRIPPQVRKWLLVDLVKNKI